MPVHHRGIVLLHACAILIASPARAQTPGPTTNIPPPPAKTVEWKANAQAGLIYLAGNSNSLGVSGSEGLGSCCRWRRCLRHS